MKLDILTIFPEYFAPLDVSLLGKARRNGLLNVHVHDLRDWTHDRHRTVDDTPYGGGPGMVMKPEPWGEAIDSIAPHGPVPRMIVPTPSGRPFTQALAVEYAAEPWLLFACGRYEGIDSRVVEETRARMTVDEISLGDFVLAGGEVAVLVMVEAIGRLLPGVLGNADSVTDDSFAPGAMESLLEGPVFTKPPIWRERPVPDVLLSGHHGAIARWRRDEALRRTARNRPELLARLDPGSLDGRDRDVLREAGFPVDADDVAD
ncbi:tRNA (guanosine(37)-N1)-methyltransferase TrmD [Actinomadura litoris]|uniref:tRNA (guanosine(37)-N1)-methyltransferase TrmD n=1 Tax=Actinomadura litoris TaxID=2678616 RepID=UPI001FA73D1D|nr:tRNA (guanosine(37)-N1)-methyltransferase TrmD [Actinomadura litoris]